MAWIQGTDEAGMPFYYQGEGANMVFARPQEYGRDPHDSTPPPEGYQPGEHITANGDKFNDRGQFVGNIYAKPSSGGFLGQSGGDFLRMGAMALSAYGLGNSGWLPSDAVGGASTGASAAGGGATSAAGGDPAALGSGLRSGSTASGIGGDAVGSGLTTGTTAGGIGGGATGAGVNASLASGGALSPGYFAAETAYPVPGGISSSVGAGIGSGAASAATSGALSRLLSGNGTMDDYLKALGAIGPAALGYLGARDQTGQFRALADKYASYGQPYRDRLSQLYADPSSFLKSPEVGAPIEQAASINARALSTNGNPTGSGNAMQAMNDFTATKLFSRLGEEKDRLAGFGGLSGYAGGARSAETSAINSNAGQYNAIGAGFSNVFNPTPSLAETMAQFKRLSTAGV